MKVISKANEKLLYELVSKYGKNFDQNLKKFLIYYKKDQSEDTRKARDIKPIETDNPQFEKGMLYTVKALDHFTRENDSETEEIFIEFIGFFLEETEYYYKFCSFYYEEVTTERDFYSPEFRMILKCAVTEYIDLDFQVLEGKFREVTMDKTKRI